MANIIKEWDHSPHKPTSSFIDPYKPGGMYDQARSAFEKDSANAFAQSFPITCPRGCVSEEINKNIKQAILEYDAVGNKSVVNYLRSLLKSPEYGGGRLAARGVVACHSTVGKGDEQRSECHVLTCAREGRKQKIFFMPGMYYLCQTCLNLLEKKQLDLDYGMGVHCWNCIQKEISRVKVTDPSLFQDFAVHSQMAGFNPLTDKVPT